ncbi:MAG: WhiB family transcriptional regulator, redox-sensing transcriptional regulator [Pseudonocardiales bacterium]|jgi:WhiB family redox-sensing transcriptional regulator|nr:WhiB family transcriptional regulator, redox-sensing transcriptional regulator [Pseudonocardiales bacterium]MDT7627112.1 WhiB family transcriptional regulator, redox-sensing transcriptional regulator [Pseudonocardiales bacterium]
MSTQTSRRHPQPAWRDEALCRQTDPELFFPEKGQTPHAARRVCAGCLVRTECLTDALVRRDVAYGVLGGMTPNERRKLLHKDAGAAAARIAAAARMCRSA